jgi:prepilin-type N-terminal cleavage/methylation domain-containing protein
MKTLRLRDRPPGRAFTLIELMVVVGIIGMIMAMGAPTLYRMMHRDGLGKTVDDLVQMCDAARAQAILQGTTTRIVFHPQERRCELQAGPLAPGAPRVTPKSVQFGDDLLVEMLDVNLIEYKDSSVARVRFFPNGTCDEMTVILHSLDNQWRKIALDITTGLASVDSDPQHWR